MIAGKSYLLASICVLALPSLNAFVQWNSLKATWCPPTLKDVNCFQDIPRTMKLALNSGWRKVEGCSCKNNGTFYGHRMVKNDDYSITPLYDELGTIAGVQVNLLKSELFAKPNPYKFDEVPHYLDNSIESHPIYSLTAYFVDPIDICSNERTSQLAIERQLELQGTGSRLYFQNGESPYQLRAIPLYRNVASKYYTNTNCINTMGYHNHYKVPKMMDSNCTKVVTSFLLFNNMGELHGFGLGSIGKLSSPNFEHQSGPEINMVMSPITPECLVNIGNSPSLGFSNVHFYFVDEPRNIKCEPIGQSVAVGDSSYINPNFALKQKHGA